MLTVIISVLVMLCTAILGKVIYRHREERKAKGFRYGLVNSNALFIGLPIIQSLLGDAGVLQLSMYMIFVRMFCWSYGLSLYTGVKSDWKGSFKRLLTHPCMIAAALGVVALLASCVSRQDAVEAESRSDSLELVVSAKDSLINAVFADINAISENLALIKSRENLITVAGESEGGRRPVEEIDNDIKAIDRLLRENRAKIESLQRSAAQLRKANLRIDGLEKMIADMNRQLAEKKGITLLPRHAVPAVRRA